MVERTSVDSHMVAFVLPDAVNSKGRRVRPRFLLSSVASDFHTTDRDLEAGADGLKISSASATSTSLQKQARRAIP